MKTKKKAKKIGKHERCAICHFPFGKGTCESCRDPKCTSCGTRLISAEVEVGSECTSCSPDAKKNVAAIANRKGKGVAIALTD